MTTPKSPCLPQNWGFKKIATIKTMWLGYTPLPSGREPPDPTVERETATSTWPTSSTTASSTQGPEVKVPVRAFKVHVGFTGAEFTLGEEKKREAFCVVVVTPASNFAFWAYFHEKFLCKPKQSDKSYKELFYSGLARSLGRSGCGAQKNTATSAGSRVAKKGGVAKNLHNRPHRFKN